MGIANISNNMAASYSMMGSSQSASGASSNQGSMPSQGDRVQLSPEAVSAMNGSAATGMATSSGQTTLAQPSQAIAKYLGCA